MRAWGPTVRDSRASSAPRPTFPCRSKLPAPESDPSTFPMTETLSAAPIMLPPTRPLLPSWMSWAAPSTLRPTDPLSWMVAPAARTLPCTWPSSTTWAPAVIRSPSITPVTIRDLLNA